MIHVRLSGNAKHAKSTDWEIEDTIHNTIIHPYNNTRYLNRAYFVQITTVQLYFVYSTITILDLSFPAHHSAHRPLPLNN